MNRRSVVAVSFFAFAPAACRTSAPAKPPASAEAARPGAPLQDQPEMEWWRKSMETRDQRIGWFRDARFGLSPDASAILASSWRRTCANNPG